MADKYINYASFDTWKWRTFVGDTPTTIVDFINQFDKRDLNTEFYIGTDSQNHSKKGKKYCIFTTVLVAYTRGKGGRAILASEKMPHIPDVRRRLINEAWRSLEVGTHLNLNKLIDEKQKMTIHLDVNNDTKFKSSECKNDLVGLITAQGFNCEHKPNAWAASWCADSKC